MAGVPAPERLFFAPRCPRFDARPKRARRRGPDNGPRGPRRGMRSEETDEQARHQHERRQPHHGHRRGSAGAAQQRPAGQDRDHADQAADHPARPVPRLFAGRRRPLPGDQAGPEQGVRLHRQGQPGRGDLERHGGARPRQSRRARRQAGDGRQVGAVQALRRHRRDRPRGRHRGRRRVRRLRAPARADLRRHQPRGHQGTRLLHHRAAPARADGHPGVPRRSARHGDHRRGRPDQRARPDRPLAGQRQARDQRRRRRGDRLHRAAQGHGHAARQRDPVRHPRRRLPGPRGRHEPVEVGPCRRHRCAHPGRCHGRRRRVLRPVREGCRRPRHGAQHGQAADRVRHGQPRSGDHAGGGEGGALGCDHRDRPLRLSEPGQQRPGLPLHLPRRARRARDHDQRGDEDRGGLCARRAGARGGAGRGQRRLSRPPAALWSGVPDPGAVRSAPDHRGAFGGRQGGDGAPASPASRSSMPSATATRCAPGSIRPRAACS